MKVFGMREQLDVGAKGVEIVKEVLKERYPDIVDLQDDRVMQKRGIDLWVGGLGYVEVKSDSHKPDNLFLELDVGGRPGAIDRSCSDCFCILFFRHCVLYFIPRAELQQWLREWYSWTLDNEPTRLKVVQSSAGNASWSARGLVVPTYVLEQAIPGIVKMEWKGE